MVSATFRTAWFCVLGLHLVAARTWAAPQIVVQPRGQTANLGGAVSFRVSATGTDPITYQWRRNQLPIPGATNPLLELPRVERSDAAGYDAVVTDPDGTATSRTATLTVVLPATLDRNIGANLRLGGDPALLPPSQSAQAEVHLARSLSDPGLLVAIFQEGRFTDAGALACGYAMSWDGGRTWQRQLVPGLTTLQNGTWPRATDPVAAISLENQVFLNTLAFSPSSDQRGILVNRSLDGGRTFSDPIYARNNLGDATDQLDKNWIAVNTWPGSPTEGRIAVTWTRFFTSSSSSNPLYCSVSDDQGMTWSPPVRLGAVASQSSQPAFLPDGSLVVVYWNFSGSSIEMATSSDGGLTFGLPTKIVSSILAYADPLARGGAFEPSLATDQISGVLYVTYQAFGAPSLLRPPRIYFTRSIDRGRTWSTPVAVSDTPDGRSVFLPAIAASPDGQHVTIVFYDKRNDPGDGNFVDLYLAESFDGGETWGANARVSEFSSDLRTAPLTSSGYMFGDYQGLVPALDLDTPGMACWIDARYGNPDPYVAAISRRQGATYPVWQRLHFTREQQQQPEVSGEGADPDHDGLPNLGEYFVGSDPTVANAIPLKVTKSTPGNGTRLIARCDVLTAVTDVDLTWQVSDDLSNWASVKPLTSSYRPHRLAFMKALESEFAISAGQRFYRLALKGRSP